MSTIRESDGADPTMKEDHTVYLANKFKGCLVGALLGDCIGEPFELAGAPPERVHTFFKQMAMADFKPPTKHRSGKLPYTDDTAQTKVLAKHLTQKGLIDSDELGRMLTKEYYEDPKRGYGTFVPGIFKQIHENPSLNITELAQQQFGGSGSYGNGAAMRVSPVALFYSNDTQQMIEAARISSLVTHAHRNGYIGAILQSLAIQQALAQDPATTVDSIAFVQDLRSKMEKIEAAEGAQTYCEKLDKMEEYLKHSPPPSYSTVIENLGHDISAVGSVPTAIFAYLMAQKPIEHIEADNLFERTLHYAISLGGDTDTIGSMAATICGAHVGFDSIPLHLIRVCEDSDKIARLADKLFEKSFIDHDGSCFPFCK